MLTKLSLLTPGTTAEVVRIRAEGPLKRRMMDMGIVAGTRVQLQKSAPLGDPLEIKIKNFNLALRKREADLVEVDTVDSVN
ncbi:MAG TPA: ferrous iron transport protein A [Patescibacteria group bacterium]|nr:ferrous iron transport protein A [Patescibacteria group bacterium]